MYPWAKKDLLKETSYYTTHLRLRDLRENDCTMSKRYEAHIKIVECKEGEPIYCDESSDASGPFCFFYATLFKNVLLRLPLSIFEKKLLTEFNVAPAQLHPNSWAFIRAFIILCAQFSISSSVEVFLYFFEVKHRSSKLWVSLNVPMEEPCFPPSSLHIRILKAKSLKFEPQ